MHMCSMIYVFASIWPTQIAKQTSNRVVVVGQALWAGCTPHHQRERPPPARLRLCRNVLGGSVHVAGCDPMRNKANNTRKHLGCTPHERTNTVPHIPVSATHSPKHGTLTLEHTEIYNRLSAEMFVQLGATPAFMVLMSVVDWKWAMSFGLPGTSRYAYEYARRRMLGAHCTHNTYSKCASSPCVCELCAKCVCASYLEMCGQHTVKQTRRDTQSGDGPSAGQPATAEMMMRHSNTHTHKHAPTPT